MGLFWLKINYTFVLITSALVGVTYQLIFFMVISDALPVQFWLSDCDTYNEKEPEGVHRKCFCHPWQCTDNIDLQFTDDQDKEYSLDIVDSEDSILFTDSFTQDGNTYSYSFTPQALSICNKEIQLKIIDDTSPESEVAKSDCLDIRTTQRVTQLITYGNVNRNFAGLVYVDASPDIEFQIRIPAIFFHSQPAMEQKGIDLTSKSINTYSQFKNKRLLETDYMPDYMHKKVMQVLMHHYVLIDGREWVAQDPYEIVEADRRWPLRKAKVLLTDKNSIIRNIL